MDQERELFGARLREQREARGLSLADLARITKIPERSIAQLEAGNFDRLPAEVFVRGFVRSYCRAVGLDADQTVRSYGELVRESRAPAPSLTHPAPLDDERDPDVSAVRPAPPVPPPPPEPTPDDRSAIGQLFSGVGRGTRRASLTLAVIILVIIATLTLSLLLRRPSHVGDGLSLSSLPSGPRRSL